MRIKPNKPAEAKGAAYHAPSLGEEHLNFIRSLGCVLCGGPSEAAHVRMTPPGQPPTGLQRRPPHNKVVPLCAYHHRLSNEAQHNHSEEEWWKAHGLDPHLIAAALEAMSPESELITTTPTERATRFLERIQHENH